MYRYQIEGGIPVKGRIRAAGNKNAALPCIAAALLTDETVRLRNVPDIEDAHVMFEILEKLGATVVRLETKGEYEVTTHNIVVSELPVDLARKIRASILFAGPILARTGRVVLQKGLMP